MGGHLISVLRGLLASVLTLENRHTSSKLKLISPISGFFMISIKEVLPLSLRCRIADLRGRGEYSFYADKHRCIFIHIPKAAGTSVSWTLFDKGSRHVPWFRYYQANPVKYRNYFKFAFVRNPWDRVVSSFFFLKRGGMAPHDKRWAEEHLADFPDFSSFVKGWVNEENIHTWMHFQPQYHFICNEQDRVMVDFVGRMENINEDFKYVAQRLGCDKSLVSKNTGNNDHYSHYYNKETRDIVERVYSKDIDIFEYSFQDRK